MAHDHDHGGGDGHAHDAPVDFGRAFIIGIGIQSAFIALEVVYGLLAHSLALLADAPHSVSDVLSLALLQGHLGEGMESPKNGRSDSCVSAQSTSPKATPRSARARRTASTTARDRFAEQFRARARPHEAAGGSRQDTPRDAVQRHALRRVGGPRHRLLLSNPGFSS